MRFVPDISDSRYPVTQGTRIKAIKMMSKQKVFLEQTKYIHTSTIAGIHIYISKIGFSLSQILMSIKSKKDESMTLFIAIDENLTGGSYEVVFTVHKDRYDEANTLVPLLCLILEEKYGKKIWEWFTDDAKRVVTKYRWDKDVNKVVLIDPDDEGDGLDLDSDDEYTKAICDMMNINEDITGDGFEFDISFIVQEVVTPVNQYGDTGSVKTFRHAFDEDGGAAAEAADNDTDASSNASSMEPTGKGSIPSTPEDSKPAAIDTSPGILDLTTPPPKVSPDEQKQSASVHDDIESTLEKLILTNPTLAQKILSKASPTIHVSPMKGVDEN
jgi:hypothetical protein